MNPLLRLEIDAKSTALEALCEKHSVASLDLFGSGSSEEWNQVDSDLDFLVTFRPDTTRISDRYSVSPKISKHCSDDQSTLSPRRVMGNR